MPGAGGITDGDSSSAGQSIIFPVQKLLKPSILTGFAENSNS